MIAATVEINCKHYPYNTAKWQCSKSSIQNILSVIINLIFYILQSGRVVSKSKKMIIFVIQFKSYN